MFDMVVGDEYLRHRIPGAGPGHPERPATGTAGPPPRGTPVVAAHPNPASWALHHHGPGSPGLCVCGSSTDAPGLARHHRRPSSGLEPVCRGHVPGTHPPGTPSHRAPLLARYLQRGPRPRWGSGRRAPGGADHRGGAAPTPGGAIDLKMCASVEREWHAQGRGPVGPLLVAVVASGCSSGVTLVDHPAGTTSGTADVGDTLDLYTLSGKHFSVTLTKVIDLVMGGKRPARAGESGSWPPCSASRTRRASSSRRTLVPTPWCSRRAAPSTTTTGCS